MKKALRILVGVSAFALSATAASAATITPCPATNAACIALQATTTPGATFLVTGNPITGTSPVTASIGDSGLTGNFTDSFVFKIGNSSQGLIGTGSGSVITFLLNGISNVGFTTVSFFNGMNTFFATITGNSASLSGVPIFGGATNSLNVSGTVSANNGTAGVGSFGGSLGFTPAVPEPATWGMMLLGFGLMGASLRRRRSNKLMQIA